ncbi:MAG: NAD(P)/FAD-dependent oxidoreductase [Candidatus Woesearchaeota archaeon]|nr:NAD(P)/FAD-dependent oxidoreductase [Candidatus Woesearchaeota archaeon]
MTEYDVIIVGAGVAGLMLASKLTTSNLKVLLLESRPTVNSCLNHRYGTFSETVEKFGLQDCIIKKYKKFAFGMIEEERQTICEYPDYKFQIVDYNLFTKNLKLSADIITKAKITSVSRERQGIIIVCNNKTYRAKIVADCSGCSQIISKKLNRPESKDPTNFLNTSWEMTNCSIPERFTDRGSFPTYCKLRNIAYWIYPYSTTECQFGYVDLVNSHFLPMPQLKEIVTKCIKKEPPYNAWFKNAKIKEEVHKISSTTITRPLVDDNLITCGEAAGATTPLFGEGFRIGLEMAVRAHTTILKAFKENNFSKESLQSYEQWFHDWLGKYYPNQERIRSLLMKYTDEEVYFLFTKNLKRLSHDEYYRMLQSNFTPKMVLKMFSGRIILHIIKQFFKYHFLGYKKIVQSGIVQ